MVGSALAIQQRHPAQEALYGLEASIKAAFIDSKNGSIKKLIAQNVRNSVEYINTLIDEHGHDYILHHLAYNDQKQLHSTRTAALGVTWKNYHNDEDAVQFGTAMALHDVGKCGDPAYGCTGPISEEQKEKHVIQGLQYCQHLPDYIREVVGKHHRLLDGSGYPDDEVLIRYDLAIEPTRFSVDAAVVDIFDAIRSNRGYKNCENLRGTTFHLLELEANGKLEHDATNSFLNFYINYCLDFDRAL